MKCDICGGELEVVDVLEFFEEGIISVQCYCANCKEMFFLAKRICNLTEEDEEWLGGY